MSAPAAFFWLVGCSRAHWRVAPDQPLESDETLEDLGMCLCTPFARALCALYRFVVYLVCKWGKLCIEAFSVVYWGTSSWLLLLGDVVGGLPELSKCSLFHILFLCPLFSLYACICIRLHVLCACVFAFVCVCVCLLAFADLTLIYFLFVCTLAALSIRVRLWGRAMGSAFAVPTLSAYIPIIRQSNTLLFWYSCVWLAVALQAHVINNIIFQQ